MLVDCLERRRCAPRANIDVASAVGRELWRGMDLEQLPRTASLETMPLVVGGACYDASRDRPAFRHGALPARMNPISTERACSTVLLVSFLQLSSCAAPRGATSGAAGVGPVARETARRTSGARALVCATAGGVRGCVGNERDRESESEAQGQGASSRRPQRAHDAALTTPQSARAVRISLVSLKSVQTIIPYV
jgi:hypothetical protein